MAISTELRQMARDDTIGMNDTQVCERTGLSYPTWRKWMTGEAPSEATILKFCTALGLDCSRYFRERERATGKRTSGDAILATALELTDLAQEDKREVMQLYREKIRNKRPRNNESAA